MTLSMTAFARVERQLDAGLFCWEIKTVNNRYLDASFRLPEAFRFMETQFRSMMRGVINRGKIECQLRFNPLNSNNQSIQINQALIDALIETGKQLADSRQLANDLSVSKLLSWPEVINLSQPDIEQLGHQAQTLLAEALQQLLSARQTEGLAMAEQIENRLLQLKKAVSSARGLIENYPLQWRDKLMTRLAGLNVDVDTNRIEQEIALMLSRLDVMEELDRLEIHCAEVARVLKSKEPIGRRLDFLMQELNREANTLSSKSDSAVLTQLAVEMKVLIEQMREQIQNIE